MTGNPPGRSDAIDILNQARAWHEAGNSAALATVVSTWGSAPRRTGALLAMASDGEMAGSVSGGCVEGAVLAEARDIMDHGTPKVLEFGVSDAEAWEVGLACGGTIRVFVEKIGPAKSALIGEVARLHGQNHAAVIATRLSDGAQNLIPPDGHPLSDAAALAIAQDKGTSVEYKGEEWFLNPFNPPLRLILVGAVHIAQTLAPAARLAGFEVRLIDPRTAFATEARFPGLEISHDWPDEAMASAPPDHRTAIVTLTHDPKIDDPALHAALKSNAFYIGCLGPKRTHAKRLSRLLAAGFSEDDVARIHGPLGLDIGAANPPEIAVAALAQIIAALRGSPVP